MDIHRRQGTILVLISFLRLSFSASLFLPRIIFLYYFILILLQDEVGIDTSDTVNHFTALRDLYLTANPEYSGRTTVPVLWDKQQRTIVNNESSEIIRMLNTEFNEFARNPALDLYPEPLRKEIDEINEFVYPNINNGVYRCGFATTQAACK